MKNAICFLLALFAVQTLHAGDKILNGGNVIVCGNNVELLDYYEARLTGKQLQFDPNVNTYSEKLRQLFERWRKVAPERIELYSTWFNKFESEAGIYPGIQIPDIPDTGSVAIPSGCTMTPAAFQRRDEDIFPGEKRYVFNKDLWDHMNEEQKAGLVLHELIYREAIRNAHETSLPTRYFNSFLATEVTPDADKYFSLVYRLPLSFGEYHGMNVQIGGVRCNNGPFGTPGCSFDYRSTYNSQTIKFNILEIVDSVKTNEFNIDFYNALCDVSNARYELDRYSNSFYFNGCGPMKNVLIKNKINVTDIQTDKKLKIIRNSLEVYGDPSIYLINVNPETSWFQSSSGVKIEHFKAFGKDSLFNDIFITVDNKYWTFSEDENAFVELVYNKKFGTKTMPCTVSSLEKQSYVCPTMPKQFSCMAPIGYGDPFQSWETITLRPVNNNIVFYRDSDEKYFVTLPKGHIVRFDKKRFGKLVPVMSSQEELHSLSWDSEGNCRLNYRY